MAARVTLHPDYEAYIKNFFTFLNSLSPGERTDFSAKLQSLAFSDLAESIAAESALALSLIENAGCPWDQVPERNSRSGTG